MNNRVDNNSDTEQPLQAQINHFVGLFNANKLPEALSLAESLIQKYPTVAQLHNMLGVVHLHLANFAAAEVACRQALELNPEFAEAHNNLGLVLLSAGRLDSASSHFQQALARNARFTEAYCNLGIAQTKAGDYADAQANLETALSQRPDYIDALNELSQVLIRTGQYEKALPLCHRLLGIDPAHTQARFNLTAIGNNITDKPWHYDANWAQHYIQLLADSRSVRPARIAAQICQLLKSHPAYVAAASAVTSGNPQADVLAICSGFDDLPLLSRFMELSPVPDLDIETTLKALRHCLLVHGQSAGEKAVLPLQQSLALHCFTNEYVYGITDLEAHMLDVLESRVEESLNGEPDWFGIVCLASFRPLQHYPWAQQLGFPRSLQPLYVTQVQQPATESLIASELTTLRTPSDSVSKSVQQQYEENPYPRWITTQFEPVRRTFAQVVNTLNLALAADTAYPACPAILIAGCGTGQQALITASRFNACDILAVDLSKHSLAYAVRKARELEVSAIDFMQADILDLPALNRQFDIVECGGVLHHMRDPMAGWAAISLCVKPGGLLRIGLYSELARQPVVTARDAIKALGIGTTTEDIIRFRQGLIDNPPAPHSPLRGILESADFWSTSAIRDLIFHTQEHRFTLPQIKACIDTLGLVFAGFELTNPALVAAFRKSFPDPADYYSLDAWHAFECDHPTIFSGMYQFWLQKPETN